MRACVDVALVRFVNHDVADAFERVRVLQPQQEDPGSAVEDRPFRAGSLAFQLHLVPDPVP